VTVFSSGLPSFEPSFELTWLKSSISTIMHPADWVNVSILVSDMNATDLRRMEPWLHQRAREGLRVFDSPLCRQTEPKQDK
jgi:hypothetical protein